MKLNPPEQCYMGDTGPKQFKMVEITPEKKVTSITIIGRRWFNKGPGNTYHSAAMYVDGECVGKIDFAYGYGDHYLWNAFNWLEVNGFLKGREHYKNGAKEMIWRYCERLGIKFACEVVDVQRKKDL